jgi:hypothetical protein
MTTTTNNKAPFLTREQAHQLIEDCCSDLMQGEDGSHAALLDLQEHWIGHRDIGDDDTPETVAAMLHEYVDANADQCAQAGWDSRGGENPPAPSDDNPTELTAPDEAAEDIYSEPVAPKELTAPRFGSKEEHRIVGGLIDHMATRGFQVHSLAIDGEDTYIRTPTKRDALCEVWEWDAIQTLRFTRGGDESKLFGVLLVPGNRRDIITDHTWDGGADVLNPVTGSFAAAVSVYQRTMD